MSEIDRRKAIGTGTYAGQSGIGAAAGTLVAARYAAWVPDTTAPEIAAVAAFVTALVALVVKMIRDRLDVATRLPPVALLFLVLLVMACSMTPRQKFYMGEVAFAGAQNAAIVYLKTPYGQRADDDVLTGIQEANSEGIETLERMRPLVPNPGQEIDDHTELLLDAGFDTMESIVERLNRTVLAPAAYEEQ